MGPMLYAKDERIASIIYHGANQGLVPHSISCDISVLLAFI